MKDEGGRMKMDSTTPPVGIAGISLCLVHRIPGLSVIDENVHGWLEQARVVEASGKNSDHIRSFLRFSAGDARTAFRAEAALMPAAIRSGVKMVA
jgi:hypothetical protein